ncbi:DUF418 domain-containing protein [Robertmurraya massiliosenegalensis]|uniref:DUF418 domain-containing protein n=1 Tax=Robertmurraya massiliosenegalensis TaxID=1287657 RepID=UPI0013757892
MDAWQLSNYILHTLIGVGVGWSGEVNIGVGILISFILFILQMLLSCLWLKKMPFCAFRFQAIKKRKPCSSTQYKFCTKKIS